MFKVSIVIPVYNSEKFLRGCLDSIVNQSMPLEDIQVILVNDGSSDGSQLIIDEYVNKYESFNAFIHDSPSGGAGKPRNTGISMVNSKYLILMDSDDRIDENFCEILFYQIEEEKSDLVCCSFVEFFDENFSYEKPAKINKSYLKPLENKIDQSNIPFTIWGKIYNLDFIKKHNLNFVHQDWEDLLFSALIFYYIGGEITFLSNYQGYLYNKIDWGNTYSSSKESKAVDGLLRRLSTLNILIDFSIKENTSVFDYFIGYLIKWHFINLFENNFSKKDNMEYVDELSKLNPNDFINLSFGYSFVNYFIKNRKYTSINVLRKLKYKNVLYLFNLLENR